MLKKTSSNIFVQITTIYIYVLITIFLLFCGTNGYTKIVESKFTAFCVICGGYIAVMAVVGIELVIIGSAKLVSPVTLLKKSSWVQRLVVLYMLITWMSAVVSPYFPATILGVSRYEGAVTITIYCVCFLLVSVFGRADIKMLYAFSVALLLFDILCFLQLAGYNPLSLYPNGYTYADAYTAYSGAYIGTLGNVDLDASFLCIVIPVLWISLLRLKNKFRFLLLIPLAASLAVLLKIFVLAGIVGVAVGGVLSVPVVLPVSSKMRKKLFAAIVAFAVLAAVAVFAINFPSGLLHEVHELLHGNFDETFGSGRLHIWRNVLRETPKHILFGTGPDTMLNAGLEAFSRYDENLGGLIVAQIDTAHNEYLNVLFHQGIFALAAYVAALILITKHWLQNSSADSAAAVLGGGVLCYIIQAFFGFSMCITAPFFWLALALLETRNAKKMEVKYGKKDH